MTRALIWSRVSTTHQETENQLADLRALATRRGDQVVDVLEVEASASTGAHRDYLRTVLHRAHRGEVDTLLVWALDRLSREGVEATVRAVRQLEQAGCQVVSYQEPWTASMGEARDLVLAVVAWVAQMESRRRGERVRAGLARRKAAGFPIGRQPGAVDLRPRRRAGYVARYDRERAQRAGS